MSYECEGPVTSGIISGWRCTSRRNVASLTSHCWPCRPQFAGEESLHLNLLKTLLSNGLLCLDQQHRPGCLLVLAWQFEFEGISLLIRQMAQLLRLSLLVMVVIADVFT